MISFDRDETSLFHEDVIDKDNAFCVGCRLRVINRCPTVTLDWSEIMDSYNTADAMRKDKRKSLDMTIICVPISSYITDKRIAMFIAPSSWLQTHSLISLRFAPDMAWRFSGTFMLYFLHFRNYLVSMITLTCKMYEISGLDR